MSRRYQALAVSTDYWQPGVDFTEKIVENIEAHVENGDIVVVSEKAVSTALGKILDEQKIKPSWNARFLAVFWMRLVWGIVLGRVCGLKPQTVNFLRRYPKGEGARHKQAALLYAGWRQALMHGSEGGIDGSNLPYSYVSLPLNRAEEVAREIRLAIEKRLGKTVTVLVVDTDKTYTFRNFHFTPRSTAVKGIHSNGGVFVYVAGRALRLKRHATPVAFSGQQLTTLELLHVSEVANRTRGSGAGRNVWEMAARFGVEVSEVSWEMLNTVKHKPIVVIKRTAGKRVSENGGGCHAERGFNG